MAKHARFDNALATGNRTASITISTTLTLTSGTINNWIDGGFGNNSTDSFDVTTGQSGKEVKFVFAVAKKITGFARYYSNNVDTSSWKLQASLDDITYVDITGSVAPTGYVDITGSVAPSGGVAKAFSTGANDNFYLYYKLVQTAGTTSNSPWYQEIEFQIVDSGTADDQAAEAPSYSNFLGSGNRRGYIIIGGTITWASGTLALIDGSAADTTFFNGGQSGQYIEFDFGTNCLITEVTFTQSNSTSHGTWKWQKDTGGGTWVDVGSSFTLGGSTSQVITTMSGETDYYKKYRLQQVSGTNSNSPFIREFTFKIGYPEIADAGITLVSPNTGSSAGGTAVTLTGTGFTGATAVTFDGTPATGVTVVSDTSITLTTPAGTLGAADIVVDRPTTDITLLGGFTYDDIPISTYVTQAPLLVINKPEQPTLVTQAALLVVSLPSQGNRITQAPLLSIELPKPVPLPAPIVPEIPLTEIWQWSTAITISENAKEQRIALRKNPRINFSFSALLLNDFDRERAFALLVRYLKKIFNYPAYQYSTKLTQQALTGASRIYYDPAQTDIRAGEFVALFNPALDQTQMVLVTTLEADGANLAAPLTFDALSHWLVSPVLQFAFLDNVGIAMDAISGELSLDMRGVAQRNVLRTGQATDLLTTYDGLPVLNKRPLANDQIEEKIGQNVEWIDNLINEPIAFSNWQAPQVETVRRYICHKPTDLDYWRLFANTVKGKQKPFLVPTYRDDLPLSEIPLVGAFFIRSTNIDFFEYWRSPSFRYARIESDAAEIFTKIVDVLMNYDASGNPETISVKFADAISNNSNLKISFVNVSRLDSDDIVITHTDIDCEVALKIRTIDK